MKRVTTTLVATAILVLEVASLGLAATPGLAQDSSAQIRRNQRLILQQQRQIEQNQRRLEAQGQRLGEPGAAASTQTIDRGIFGNIGNCPVGWTYGLFTGCLPAVHVIH